MTELPDDIRVPLHELQADMDYLFGRVAADGSCAAAMSSSVKIKLSKLEAAIRTTSSPSRVGDEVAGEAFTPQTPMTNFNRSRQEAAPPKPAPDAMRKIVRRILQSRVRLVSTAEDIEADIANVDEVTNLILAALSAPVPLPDGAGDKVARAFIEHGFNFGLSPSPAVAAEPDALADLVSRFSAALLGKLRYARDAKGRSGWDDPKRKRRYQLDLPIHVAKGDPLDVAAIAAFCWHHGWSTALTEKCSLCSGEGVLPPDGGGCEKCGGSGIATPPVRGDREAMREQCAKIIGEYEREAWQWLGDELKEGDPDWVAEATEPTSSELSLAVFTGGLSVWTARGKQRAKVRDFIVRVDSEIFLFSEAAWRALSRHPPALQ